MKFFQTGELVESVVGVQGCSVCGCKEVGLFHGKHTYKCGFSGEWKQSPTPNAAGIVLVKTPCMAFIKNALWHPNVESNVDYCTQCRDRCFRETLVFSGDEKFFHNVYNCGLSYIWRAVDCGRYVKDLIIIEQCKKRTCLCDAFTLKFDGCQCRFNEMI